MGGGDLNLKKSWHPHTLKNQEKVWKAEKAKDQEERKLQDLRKEIEQEKGREELRKFGESTGVLAKTDGDKKLEWMYQSSTQLINRDEYLLGRKIDKSFELLQAEEQGGNDQKLVGVKQPLNHVEHECIPFSIRAYRGTESTEQVDLQRKVMEDPLMLIKQREMDSRRKLLENPVKLKELHRILKTDQVLNKTASSKSKKKSKKSKSKKSKKSKKKHKKRSKSSSSSSTETSDSESANNSESDDDLDRKLAKRYKKLKGSLDDEQDLGNGMSLSKLLDAKYETISKELDRAVDTKSKSKSEMKKYRSRSRSNNRHHSRSRSPPPTRDYHRRQQRDDRRERRRSRSPPPNNRNRNNYRRSRSRSRSPKNHSKSIHTAAPKRSTLTEEEKQARCREMMKNAEWRESDRTSAVQKHRDAYEKEEQHNRAQDFDKNFINKEVKKAISNHTSVGSRIRSNLNNIQRTQSSMNSNFARK